MSKYIYACWWNTTPNLGDALTPYIIGKLSGRIVRYIGVSFKDVFRELYSSVLNTRRPRKDYLWPIRIFKKQYIAGVGSILNFASAPECIVWGSGFINSQEKFKGGKVVAVRGKLTENKLQSEGVPHVGIYGDPALLLPVIFNPDVECTQKIAIIPNYTEYDFFKSRYDGKYDIIDLRSSDIEGKIKEFKKYSYILSTSLHGLIIGHAYGIPAIWIQNSVLAGDQENFKFRDYFSSVGVEYYEPFRDIDKILNSDVDKFFSERTSLVPSMTVIKKIQKQLIRVAPFPVLTQYKVDI